MLAHLRNFQFDIPDIGHREEVGDLPPAPDQTPVLLDTEQHVRRLPAVSNDHRPPFGGLLGPPGVLVELAAGQRGDGHGGDRKSVVEGKSVSVRVDLGGGRIIKKKNSRQLKYNLKLNK